MCCCASPLQREERLKPEGIIEWGGMQNLRQLKSNDFYLLLAVISWLTLKFNTPHWIIYCLPKSHEHII